MRLFIAEKPSVAKAIAGELGITSKQDGFIECGNDTITWCFGHMLELAEPDEYTDATVPRNPVNGKKRWRVDELPIIPATWRITPKKDAEKQLKVIAELLTLATEIVNAGDSDREGQLLIDEVLDYFNNTKPVFRFWVSAHDATSLQRGLDNLQDNNRFLGFGAAAKGRARADWLIGMNLSRAYTLRAERGGSRVLLTVGRVQTPTLAMVVGRDREIEAFKSQAYHTIKAVIQYKDSAFIANWRAHEHQKGLDSDDRLIDLSIANALVETISGASGVIKDYKQEPKTKAQPRAFSLSDITLLASNKYGYTAIEVLEACQALYETHKLTSYPRTDCSFLPESQHKDAPSILDAIKTVNPALSALVDGADTAIKSNTWDDSKIGVHYGIIPTMHKGNIQRLSDKERVIYDLIVRAYIAQFYPLHESLSTTVAFDVAGEMLETSGNVVTHEGWRVIYNDVDEENNGDLIANQTLPAMSIGDDILCVKATRQDTKTKPPARFTEGTLQRAMENIHKIIVEPEHKKMLRDGDGIGTSATRASIISELKRRHCLDTKGKQIISTTLGRSIVDALPDVVKSPVLTAMYERILRDIDKDPAGLDAFVDQQIKFVRAQVAKANEGSVTIKGAKEAIGVSDVYFCIKCSAGLCRRPGKKGFWWSCSAYPNCKETYPDSKGKPLINTTK